MKKSSIGLWAGNRLSLAAVVSLLLLAYAPAQANVDYVFFSINGDTSLSAMTQGDTVGWGSNCTVGALLHWQIWLDIDADGIIDIPGDRVIFEFDVRDGDTSPEGPPPDNNPVPDGWYIMNPMLLAIAPAHYIFFVSEYESHTAAARRLLSNPLLDPPNIFRGQVTIDGHPAPDSAALDYLWIEASEEQSGGQMWSALTDEYGNYEINIGETGSNVLFGINTPDIEGYVTPSPIHLTAYGIIENVDFYYTAPTDSIYGNILDQNDQAILGDIGGNCNRGGGSESKEFRTTTGYYVVYFGPSEYGMWNINLNYENLVPQYIIPNGTSFDNSVTHSQRIEFTCRAADAYIYARVAENGGAPSHRYSVQAQSQSLQSWTQAISDTGAGNISTLHISSMDNSGWELNVQMWNQEYPIPPGYVLETGNLINHAPGDTVIMNFVSGHCVSDTVKVDAGDPGVNWNSVWVSLSRSGNFIGTFAGNDGVFTLYADTGTYFLGANCEGYLAAPNNRQFHLLADTTGGLGFVLNHKHCRVSGTLTNVQLPINQSIGVPAYTSPNNDGYATMLHVDSLTGQFGGYLCDGEWSLDPPQIFNRFAPAQGHLSIAENPDSVKYIEFAYIDPSSVDEEAAVPTEFTLEQNYPNPFNGQTVIGYGLPNATEVTIEIYDLLGRQVMTLQNGAQNAGYHDVTWNAARQPSGIYFYRIKAGDFTEMRKMLLLK